MAERPRRLGVIFEQYAAPLWFVTFNTHQRERLLATTAVHDAFIRFSTEARNRGITVGRYVFMPDHVHLFVSGPPTFHLSRWIRLLKLSLSAAVPQPTPHWQEGFFDHLVRQRESYRQKWDYVLENPVRAGLVAQAEDWPFQGEINPLPHT
jgi:REP element-mobilizing transposase RayT